MTTPISWGDTVALNAGTWEDLPDAPVPYYIDAKEGRFLHRRTALGRGVVRHYKTPPKLQPIGNWNGSFRFDANPIPARIYAQAVHFFRRIFEKYHTEAEVLITQHHETKEYRLYVPTQRTAHGGVYSIYDTKTISPGWLVVGTFHSHCDFSPGHSGIDEGDARDMDGIHGTIGFITRDVPEMALMVAMNKTFFHFSDFTGVVDTSDLNADTAPEWWDRYVWPGKVTDEMRPKWATDDDWEVFMGRKHRTQTGTIQTYRPQASKGDPELSDETVTYLISQGFEWDPSSKSWKYRSKALRDSEDFNSRLPSPWATERMPSERRMADYPDTYWDPEWDLYESLLSGKSLDSIGEEDYWEDALGKQYVERLFNTGLITEEDVDLAVANWPESGTPLWWERRMATKMTHAVAWLRSQGYGTKVSLNAPRRPVPGQTTVDEHIEHPSLPA